VSIPDALLPSGPLGNIAPERYRRGVSAPVAVHVGLPSVLEVRGARWHPAELRRDRRSLWRRPPTRHALCERLSAPWSRHPASSTGC